MGELTLNDFTNELKSRGFDGFDDVSLERYVNWGYYYVARKCRWLWEQATFDFTVSPGETSVLTSTIPNFRTVRKLVSVSSDHEFAMEPMSDYVFENLWLSRDLTTNDFRSEPSSYILYNNRLWVLPPPLESRDFTVHYWQRVPKLASGDHTLMPDDTDEVVLTASLYRCHRRANQWNLARQEYAELQSLLDDLMADQAFEMFDRQDNIIPDPDWDGNIDY